VDAVVESLKGKLPGYQIYSIEQFTSLFSVERVRRCGPSSTWSSGCRWCRVPGGVSLHVHGGAGAHAAKIGVMKALGASRPYVVNIMLRRGGAAGGHRSVVGILFTYGTRWAIMTFVPASLTQVIVPPGGRSPRLLPFAARCSARFTRD